MFNSTVLDMVILLFFTYFISSVLVTVVNEMVSTILNLRSNELERTLNNLLFDSEWTAYVKTHIISSPFYQSLKKEVDPKSKPSYMPAENFAKAIIQSLRLGTETLTIDTIKENLKTNINKLPASLQTTLLGYADTAEDKMEKFQEQIEGFYNNAMDRASGWYKRKIKPISIAVSFVLVIILNIDTIAIINSSIQNPEAVKAAADSIVANMHNIYFNVRRDTTTGDTTVEFTIQDKKTGATIKKEIKTNSTDSTIEALKAQYGDFDEIKKQLDNKVYSFGYTSKKDFITKWTNKDKHDYSKNGFWAKLGFGILYILLKLIGIGITVLALQAGSSYWFQTLNKVINLRGTGAKPDDDGDKK